MRLAALAFVVLLASPARAQLEARNDGIRVSYEYGLAALGDILDNSVVGEDGWETGIHQAVSLSVPLDQLGLNSPFSLRVAWIRVEEDSGAMETKSFPGIYLAATPSLGGAFGYTMDFAAGYDLYNKEGNLWLTWIPTLVGGIGPHLEIGSVRAEALFGGQFTSFAQGGAAYGKVSVAIGV